MNTLPLHALPRVLLATALVCAAGWAQAQSNSAPATPPRAAAPVAPPPPTVTAPDGGQAQLERSMAQGRGTAPAVASQDSAPAAKQQGMSPLDAAEQSLLDRKTQKVERLHFEDRANRVDEVRAGGQTQSITVQPKDGAPAYQVQPASPTSARPDAGIGQTGPRVWRIHQF